MGKLAKVLEKSGHTLGVGFKRAQKEKDMAAPSNPVQDEAVKSTAPTDKVVEVQQEDTIQPSLSSSSGWDERLTKVVSFSNEVSEAFRVLRSKVLMPQPGKKVPRSIMVTSALPQEGKSFVSANLGIALAQGVDQHSLLVDCDLRVPSLAKLFGVPNERGLADYLHSGSELGTLIQKTSVDKMSIITSGIPPVNPAELLGSVLMHDLVQELSSRYPDRFVIFDTPPLQVASESVVLSHVVDGVILVVRHGVSSRQLVERVINDIGRHKIIGVIFNGHKTNFITSRLVNKSHYHYGSYYNRSQE